MQSYSECLAVLLCAVHVCMSSAHCRLQESLSPLTCSGPPLLPSLVNLASLASLTSVSLQWPQCQPCSKHPFITLSLFPHTHTHTICVSAAFIPDFAPDSEGKIQLYIQYVHVHVHVHTTYMYISMFYGHDSLAHGHAKSFLKHVQLDHSLVARPSPPVSEPLGPPLEEDAGEEDGEGGEDVRTFFPESWIFSVLRTEYVGPLPTSLFNLSLPPPLSPPPPPLPSPRPSVPKETPCLTLWFPTPSPPGWQRAWHSPAGRAWGFPPRAS